MTHEARQKGEGREGKAFIINKEKEEKGRQFIIKQLLSTYCGLNIVLNTET